MAGAYDDVHVLDANSFERIHRTAGIVCAISPTERHQNSFDWSLALHRATVPLAELWTQQCEARTEHELRPLWDPRLISRLHSNVQVLVQQRVAVVLPVGKVVNDEDAPDSSQR
jgi:hypothetical protein